MPAAGLVVERSDAGSVARSFLPMGAVRSIVRTPKLEPLLAAPSEIEGLGLVDGEVLLVIRVGAAHDPLLVCDWFGESIGLVGLVPLRSGVFEEASGGIMFEEELISTFDFQEVGQLLLRRGAP